MTPHSTNRMLVLREESNMGKDPGMLLSFSFKPDLSHTSILYYYHIIDTKIFEYWRQVVSKNKNLICWQLNF
jgi:hypothetical protein